MSGVQIPLPRPKALAKREFPSVNRIDVGNFSLPRIRPRPQRHLQAQYGCATIVCDRRRRRPWTAAASLPLCVRRSPFSELVPPVSRARKPRCGAADAAWSRPIDDLAFLLPPADPTPRHAAAHATGKLDPIRMPIAPLPSSSPVLRTSDLALPILFCHLRSPRALSAFAVGPSQANRSQTRNKSLYS